LHGGPGGGFEPFYRQYFDPNAYRIILFDQRGAGKSTPSACLEENTTWDLVNDVEKIRKHMGVEKWVVFGGSWGSTLALAYAQKHTDKVKALVLRGIFTLREEELKWFYQEGASLLFPDAWEKFLEPIPLVERWNLMSAYHRRLTGKNQSEKIRCAFAWSVWEMSTSRLLVDPKHIARASEDEKFSLIFSTIESHYFINGGFFEYDGQLIKEAHKLANIPGIIVQGRYDVVCPAKAAYDLHKAWPKSELFMVPDAGHSIKESGIVDQLIRATDKYKDL